MSSDVGSGLVIAFIGSDGSGKSTARTSTSEWLGEKIDVLSLYLGSGQGPSSVARRALGWLRQVGNRSRRPEAGRPGSTGGPSRETKGRVFLSQVYRIIWALLLASEKRRKLRRAWTARNRGMVVLADHFPQNQVFGFNDGPLLTELRNHTNVFARSAARWEWKQYQEMFSLYPPDLVVRLRVSPDVASIRRPEMSVEETSRKQHALFTVKWRAEAIVTIDADQDLESVTKEIRTKIWSGM